MSTAASKVESLIRSFADDAFTRRELLHCGSEDAVDRAGKLLQLLVRLTEGGTVPANFEMIEAAALNLIRKAERLLKEDE